MSEFSEHELKDAAQRCLDGGFGTEFATTKDYYKSQLHAQDTDIVSRFVLQELSRRDAERAERALPITAEWCLANGAAWNNHRAVAWWRILDNARLEFNAANGVAMIVGDGWSYFDNITTRGQLLDLLKALRGGT